MSYESRRARDVLLWALTLAALLVLAFSMTACQTYAAVTSAPPGAIAWVGDVFAALFRDIVSLVSWVL